MPVWQSEVLRVNPIRRRITRALACYGDVNGYIKIGKSRSFLHYVSGVLCLVFDSSLYLTEPCLD